jgi:hypothetical protein
MSIPPRIREQLLSAATMKKNLWRRESQSKHRALVSRDDACAVAEKMVSSGISPVAHDFDALEAPPYAK